MPQGGTHVHRKRTRRSGLPPSLSQLQGAWPLRGLLPRRHPPLLHPGGLQYSPQRVFHRHCGLSETTPCSGHAGEGMGPPHGCGQVTTVSLTAVRAAFPPRSPSLASGEQPDVLGLNSSQFDPDPQLHLLHPVVALGFRLGSLDMLHFGLNLTYLKISGVLGLGGGSAAYQTCRRNMRPGRTREGGGENRR